MDVGRGLMLIQLAALVLVAVYGPTDVRPPVFTTASGKWDNLVQINSVIYQTWDLGVPAGRPLAEAELGPIYARIESRLANDRVDPNYRLKDGDATRLDAGTPLYTVNGYAPTFRLAVRQGQQILLYEATYNYRATRGADMFDIAGKVQSISIHGVASPRASMSQLGVIADPQEVALAVDLIRQTPIYNGAPPPAGAQFFVLVLHLHDGTVVKRWYNSPTGEILQRLYLPEQFGKMIRQIILPSSPAPPTAPSLFSAEVCGTTPHRAWSPTPC